MKLLLSSLFVILLIFGVRAQTVNSELQISIPQGSNSNEFKSHHDFIVGQHFTTDVFIPNTESYVEVIYEFDSMIDFVGLQSTITNFEVISVTANSVVIRNTIPLVEGNILWLDFKTSNSGELCETDILEITARATYYTNDSFNSATSDFNLGFVTCTGKYDSSYYFQHMNLSNQSNICYGSTAIYKFNLKGPGSSGGFDLYNPVLEFHTPGEVLNAKIVFRDEIDLTLIDDTQCLKRYTWEPDKLESITDLTIEIVVDLSCVCIDENEEMHDVEYSAKLSGKNPCGTSIADITKSVENTIEVTCCTGYEGIPPLVYVGASSYCSQDCGPIDGYLYFKNSQRSYPLINPVFRIEIPLGIEIESINVDENYFNDNSVRPTEICLETNLSQLACYQVGVDYTEPDFIISDYISAQEFVTSMEFRHNYVVPAFDTGVNTSRFKFTSNLSSNFYFDFVFYADNYTNQISGSSREIVYRCNSINIQDTRVRRLDDSNYSTHIEVVPNDVFKLACVLKNSGSSSSPLCYGYYELPVGIEYIGNPTFYEGTYVTTGLTPLPSTSSGNGDFNYNALEHRIEWRNVEVDYPCETNSSLLKWVVVDLKVAPGTQVGYVLPHIVGGGENYTNGNRSKVKVLSNFDYDVDIQLMCDSETLLSSPVSIVASEDFQLFYSLTNTGNIPIKDVKILLNKPRIGDESYDFNGNVMNRNSEFTIDFISGPYDFSNPTAEFAFSTSSNGLDAPFQASGNTNFNNDYLEVYFPSTLNAGEVLYFKIDHQSENAPIGLSAYYDISFTALRADVSNTDVSIGDRSEEVVFDVDTESGCSQLLEEDDCNYSETLHSSVENAFEFIINDNEVAVSAINLDSSIGWYPLWEPGYVGGSGEMTGSGNYPSSYRYETSGEHTICFSITEYESGVENDDICNCTIICKTIMI